MYKKHLTTQLKFVETIFLNRQCWTNLTISIKKGSYYVHFEISDVIMN